MDKQLRITLLLILDSVFAILELVVGYAVHSLALVADSFHMFNDILSLIVALWAVKVAKSGTTPTFSYGLQRAEVLGALVNAVFLLALCVTICLEAIQRFIDPPEISNPKLILVVGIAGLLSNILGLVLFHEHGHSHGGSGHGHSHGSLGTGDDAEAQVGRSSHSRGHRLSGSDINELMPESVVAREEERLLSQSSSYGSTHDSGNSQARGHGHSHDHSHSHGHEHESRGSQGSIGSHGATGEGIAGHDEHHHSRPKSSELSAPRRSMNMEGVFLHVLGDALGNVGVIATALFIWKTDYSWRFYFDPIVSLLITAVIFSTAVPLCLRASKVLLQGTPSFINCEEVAEDIQSLPGVREIHDLHIWQLSEDRVVGTLHVTIDGPSSSFSKMSRTIQECFAGHGVPSITIQPEFIDDPAEEAQPSGLRQCQSNGNLLDRS